MKYITKVLEIQHALIDKSLKDSTMESLAFDLDISRMQLYRYQKDSIMRLDTFYKLVDLTKKSKKNPLSLH